jgi:glycosyltransferase involved in cell wall biosynthesis
MRIDVIIPVRDGAALLPGCLDAVRAQTLAPARIHVSVAPSTDDTARVVAAMAVADPRIVIHDNPAGDRGSALNLAIAALAADVEAVAMVDAQSRLEPDYLERAASVLEATGAAVAGGPMRPASTGLVGAAIAAALTSRAGVGDSGFHFEGEPCDAETVYLGVYRRSVLDAVGPYDPRLIRTEDDDMNARIRAAGGRIRLDPSIRSTYLGRTTLGALYRQYFWYGHSKVSLAAARPDAIRARHLAPAALVAGLVGAAGVSVLGWRPALPVALGGYGALLATAALMARGRRLTARLLMPLALAAMHLGYGIGSWTAILGGRWRR